jgi:pyruvate dehydrogenase E2 component (dihydrolipoamide acetyltransferase)
VVGKPGDRVKRGDVVAVVETQKGAIEVEIFSEGVVSELVVPVGAKVPVGRLIARVSETGKAPARPPAPAVPVPTVPAVAPRLVVPSVTRPAHAARGARISPAARRRAAELRVDVSALSGTGVEGAITLADVEAAATHLVLPPPKTPPAGRKAFDPAEMRKAIAGAMSRSKREIPHYYLAHTVDLGPALAWLETFNVAQPVPNRLLTAVLLLKAAALGLREVPQLNGTYVDGAFRPGDGVHVGWAISLRGGGLVAPSISDTDRRSLPELMSQMRDLVQRARTGGLRSSELASPTVTVTSLGDRGAETVMGIIYPPQVALIGFGMIGTRPWVVKDHVEPRPVVTVSLAADHRASDGHIGALLLSAIERLLQEPAKL